MSSYVHCIDYFTAQITVNYPLLGHGAGVRVLFIGFFRKEARIYTTGVRTQYVVSISHTHTHTIEQFYDGTG